MTERTLRAELPRDVECNYTKLTISILTFKCAKFFSININIKCVKTGKKWTSCTSTVGSRLHLYIVYTMIHRRETVTL